MASSRPDNNEVIEQSSTGSRRITRLLSVVTVLGVLIGVAGLLVPQVFSYANSETVSDRKQVVARTTDFAVAMNTYDVAKVDDYQKRVDGLLSESYKKQFIGKTDAFFKALKDRQQVSNDAKVLAVAVDSIDKDSALVLVAVDSAITNTEVKAAIPRHLRWSVTLVKQQNSWKVSKFESVGTLEASTGQPSATPSAQSTEGSTSK
ncbi:MAG: hypothetical protein H7288_00575 [Kineosporiaceae bacterium]|nr:hypothetical protein [Aeromicrobium sp.]